MEIIKGEHVPECNDKCEGDLHYLIGDGPEVVEEIEQLPPGEYQTFPDAQRLHT